MTRFDPLAVEAILFDLDGTLIDTDDEAVAALARRLALLARLVHLAPDALARRLVMWAETPGNALVTLFDRAGVDDNLFAIGDTLRGWRGLRPRGDLPLVPGVEPAIRALAQRYRLAIVTTRGRRDAEAFLDGHNLAHLFSAVATRESTRRVKPHPAPIHFVAERLGLPPQRCVMVGDTTVDVRSARAAGAWVAAVLSGFGTRDELKRAGAHLVLDSVAQLAEIFWGRGPGVTE
jgi:phosphoglycolate phosphatase-like HAD superfamily hydrolase